MPTPDVQPYTFSSNFVHDIFISRTPITYIPPRNVGQGRWRSEGKECSVKEGCGETIYQVFQGRPELAKHIETPMFHVVDMCLNCGTFFAIQ